MNPVNPVSSKLASFFKYGGVSGEQLSRVQEEQVRVTRSYDAQPGRELSLNCVSKTVGIARSLFSQAANSGFSVACEEAVGTGGIIDDVIRRRGEEIRKYEEEIRSMGISNIVTIETASLQKIICKDEEFLINLQEKAHRTALFVFDLEAQEGEKSAIGCKETRRRNVSPDQIKCVIISERYRDIVTPNSREYGIPLDKVIFVDDTEESISVSYK